MSGMSDAIPQVSTTGSGRERTRNALVSGVPFIGIFAIASILPFVSNDYWVLIATRTAIYWLLVGALNLVVGFAGQLAIGYVAILTLGAYVTTILVAGNVLPPVPPFAALAIAGVAGSVFGVIIGLPALRLRTFYFAITTFGFATIVTQVALAWQSVTGGGIGLPGPEFSAPFNSRLGFYFFCLACAALCTWMTSNVAHSRFGRGLIAIRDAEVAAEAAGISKARLLITIFIFTGAAAAIAGGLFASLQTYITPDAFTFDLSILFFISILIGGRGSILGPMLGTIILTLLPEIAAPLATWSTFLYACLLLAVVLALPGGIAALLDFKNRRPLMSNRAVVPQASAISEVLQRVMAKDPLLLRGVVLGFGGVRAVDGVDLEVLPSEVHGLIGPNGSGKTTILNIISGYYRPEAGSVSLGEKTLQESSTVARARNGIARTFQTPRIVGEATVLQNVLIGSTIRGRASFLETLLSLTRHRQDEDIAHAEGLLALRAVGLQDLADVRADRLQHSELRFMEIARALMARPSILLLDEPAAGLSANEINRLGKLVKEIRRCGIAILVVEHHADLIFDICDRVTVLNLGQVLAKGTPAEIRVHKEVVSAYLGG
jgi:branched-chain amino acid transport system ATP-binding protein/branched-chain amino acid transport system permease protein